MKKASFCRCLSFCPLMREGGLHFRVMLCGRGLRTTHIHRPITTFLAAKIQLFYICAAVLENFFFIYDSF